jgi:hypothetical protein
VAAFAVVITIDPEGQITLQLFGCDAAFGVTVKIQFVLQGGEQALHHSVIPTAALAGHAASDAISSCSGSICRWPRARFRASSTSDASMEAPKSPANDAAAEQIHPVC